MGQIRGKGTGLYFRHKGQSYPLSYVKRIIYNSQTNRDGVRTTCEVVISTSPIGPLGLLAL